MATEYATVKNGEICIKCFTCLSKYCKKEDEEEDGDVYVTTNVNLSFVYCNGNSSRGHDINRDEYKNTKN